MTKALVEQIATYAILGSVGAYWTASLCYFYIGEFKAGFLWLFYGAANTILGRMR